VFTQKITDSERVLAALLYQRKLCTQDTLAELFQVSRRTIGDVVREVGPILTQDGFTPTPAAARFANAANLLDSIPAATDTATRPD
jgi:Helix-turn-helix of DDE superfamily endonuclease